MTESEDFFAAARAANEAFHAAKAAGNLDAAARIHLDSPLAGQEMVDLAALAFEQGDLRRTRRFARQAIARRSQIGARLVLALSWIVLLPPLLPSFGLFLLGARIVDFARRRRWIAAASALALAYLAAIALRHAALLVATPAQVALAMYVAVGGFAVLMLTPLLIDIAHALTDRD
ncbi:MAG: hypothetical protein IPL88_00075 [Rhizobiales bacterium]|nr:hypothetical protein [Hyphomicrobiales bacterium]